MLECARQGWMLVPRRNQTRTLKATLISNVKLFNNFPIWCWKFGHNLLWVLVFCFLWQFIRLKSVAHRRSLDFSVSKSHKGKIYRKKTYPVVESYFWMESKNLLNGPFPSFMSARNWGSFGICPLLSSKDSRLYLLYIYREMRASTAWQYFQLNQPFFPPFKTMMHTTLKCTMNVRLI